MTAEIIALDSGWPYSKAKTAVLSAAAAVIREEGPRAATLKNIAGRAGITEPAIFRHFDGVDGLFAGLFSAFERIDDRCQQAFSREEEGLARLREATLSIVDTIAASGDYAYILVHAEHVFRGYPDLRARVAELRKAGEKNYLECVKEGVSAGDIRSDIDAAAIATAALGLIFLTARTWIESGFAFNLRDVCEARWDDVERMFATKPAARSSSKTARLRSAALKVEARAPKSSKAAPKRASKSSAKAPSRSKKK
jgi:AcrR family transcriptional regulator